MTFSAGSGRSKRHSRRNRPGQSPTQAAPRVATTRSARSTTRTATTSPPRSRKSRPDRTLRGKLQPLVLPSHLPSWLQSLMQVQRGVLVGTIVLSTVALGTYGWSVYSQQQWGMAYNQLQRLQRNERQLISGNEMMKNQIAQQVDPKTLGLAPQKADDVIFIKPESGAVAPPDQAATVPTDRAQPLGY